MSCVVAAALFLASFGYPPSTIANNLALFVLYVSLVRMYLVGSGNEAHDVPLFASLRCVFSRRLELVICVHTSMNILSHIFLSY